MVWLLRLVDPLKQTPSSWCSCSSLFIIIILEFEYWSFEMSSWAVASLSLRSSAFKKVLYLREKKESSTEIGLRSITVARMSLFVISAAEVWLELGVVASNDEAGGLGLLSLSKEDLDGVGLGPVDVYSLAFVVVSELVPDLASFGVCNKVEEDKESVSANGESSGSASSDNELSKIRYELWVAKSLEYFQISQPIDRSLS